jgi:poly(hydroxyalkanoate) depolymerase family esterase
MRAVGLIVVASLVGCGPELSLEPTESFTASRSEALTQVTGFGSNPGSLSLFVYEPASLGTNVPLVVALHGCTQTADAYAATGWNALADQRRFLVAYPQTTANGSCFDWFTGSQQSRSGPQVTSILQMVQHLVNTKGVDPTRVYVTGLSAGGAMTNVLLAVAPDVFSRGAVMAGLPFACATTQANAFSCMSNPADQTPAHWGNLVRAVTPNGPAPRVSLWHGTSDSTVNVGNLAEEVDQWTDVNGIDATADQTTTVGVATRREFRNASGVTVVESWSLSGMNHGTAVDPPACGTAGEFILDVNLCSSAYAADFFGLTGSGGNDGGVTPPPVDAGLSTVDAGMTTTTCLGEWFATNVNHFSAGRAVLCSGKYCAVGSGDLLGNSLDMTWVRQTAVGRFEAGRCTVATDAGTATGGGSGTTGGGAGTTGGGSGTTGGGAGATGGGNAATGGGNAATGGGNAATGGGNAATGGGSAASGGGTAAGGGGGAGMTPAGCGCSSVEFSSVFAVAVLWFRRRRA